MFLLKLRECAKKPWGGGACRFARPSAVHPYPPIFSVIRLLTPLFSDIHLHPPIFWVIHLHPPQNYGNWTSPPPFFAHPTPRGVFGTLPNRNHCSDVRCYLKSQMGVWMGGWPQSAFTSFGAFFEDGSQHHTKRWGWQSAFTIVNLAIKVSIHTKNRVDSQHTKKIEPPNSAYFQAIKSIETSSGNSIPGLDYAPPSWSLKK